MVFSNAVFLFIFLPIVLLGYYLLRGSIRNYWLLAVSLIFYAWNKPSFLWILFASIIINYLGALSVEKAQQKKFKLLLLWVAIALNLIMLFYFKYFNFTISIIERVIGRNISFAEVILPIGISFFTFQGLSYVVDVYRSEVPAQKNLFKLGMYISLFPQLVAGPIVRYKDVVREIDKREVGLENFVCGARRFIIGLFKKIIIADSLAVTADAIFSNDPFNNSVAVAWTGIIAYSLQLFFDFSGYSDMAIGMGHMFGFNFLENFNYPYISKSITEFWRRWHMSLSSFFRDYVYIPLGGNRKHVYLNIAIVFCLTGIWHGAAFSFIAWGLWHGFFNLAERVIKLRKKESDDAKAPSKVMTIVKDTLAHIYTLLVVVIGWVFFRAPGLKVGLKYLLSMFGLYNSEIVGYMLPTFYLDNWTIIVLVVAIFMATPIPKNLLTKIGEKLPKTVCLVIKDIFLMLALLLCVLQVASNTYSSFIYFQF